MPAYVKDFMNISIDLETFSDVDISKGGVYRYAESDNFEILLFAYAIDGGEVVVVDMAQGEKIPENIINAITDRNITKWAFNSQFERICLSMYFKKHRPELMQGNYLDPEGWKCSMTWCAYMGLPMSLAGAGAVLGLEQQKLTEGKELIRYFCIPCKPTKVNGGRIRNLPEHDTAKWENFVRYNKRDVEVEMAIQAKLSHFPVPENIWEEFWVDQRINDRGIEVDMEFARNAIELDKISRESLMEEVKNLTGLENPNSVIQLKEWLHGQGLEFDSLDKNAVAAILPTAPPVVQRVLRIRQKLAKSSVKKYQAMENTVCNDSRARGMFRFYGASRTGRWCLTGDHEVLTDNGWVRLDEWTGGRIACWNAASEGVSFQIAEAVCFDYDGPMYNYMDIRISQCSTPDHKMRVQRKYGSEWVDMTVEAMSKCRPVIPINGYRYHRGCANPAWLKVLIMTQADGFYADDGSIKFHFKKQRKVERCKMLLRKTEIAFIVRNYKDGTTNINIPARAVPLWLRQFRTKTFGYWLLDENPDIFFDELPNWDGYYSAHNSIQYTTTNKQNADIVQALAHMSGRCCSMKIKHHPEKVNWSDAYVLNIWLAPKNAHEIKVKPEIVPYKGKVYCAVTSTGYFLVRREGRVWVTGNSGKSIQLQNLPQNHISDLAEARALVKAGSFEAVSMLYDDVPDTLSQLIRTAFVPKTGYKFVVADFSAIEARVLAYLAKEQWVLDTFAAGKDIYCATASKMFHCNVEKNGENGELRQKGKRATLSCGYGGSVGALIAMGALESGMEESELQPLVDAWRKANPHIVNFWWSVDGAAKEAVIGRTTTSTHGIRFIYKSGMLFIELPSGRRLAYVKPKMGENRFGGESIIYEGTNGTTKKWERLETFGGKLVENITQAVSRDILMFAIRNMKDYRIVAHVHDEVIVECPEDVSVDSICQLMSKTPDWAEGLTLKAEGYEGKFYQK